MRLKALAGSGGRASALPTDMRRSDCLHGRQHDNQTALLNFFWLRCRLSDLSYGPYDAAPFLLERPFYASAVICPAPPASTRLLQFPAEGLRTISFS